MVEKKKAELHPIYWEQIIMMALGAALVYVGLTGTNPAVFNVWEIVARIATAFVGAMVIILAICFSGN